MTTINSIPAARQIAFTGKKEKSEFNTGKATMSALLPGTGQLAKGEITNGLVRLGIDAVAIGTGVAVQKGKLGLGKGASIAAAASYGAFILNRINSAFDAFKPKKSEETPQA